MQTFQVAPAPCCCFAVVDCEDGCILEMTVELTIGAASGGNLGDWEFFGCGPDIVPMTALQSGDGSTGECLCGWAGTASSDDFIFGQCQASQVISEDPFQEVFTDVILTATIGCSNGEFAISGTLVVEPAFGATPPTGTTGGPPTPTYEGLARDFYFPVLDPVFIYEIPDPCCPVVNQSGEGFPPIELPYTVDTSNAVITDSETGDAATMPLVTINILPGGGWFCGTTTTTTPTPPTGTGTTPPPYTFPLKTLFREHR